MIQSNEKTKKEQTQNNSSNNMVPMMYLQSVKFILEIKVNIIDTKMSIKVNLAAYIVQPTNHVCFS